MRERELEGGQNTGAGVKGKFRGTMEHVERLWWFR